MVHRSECIPDEGVEGLVVYCNEDPDPQRRGNAELQRFPLIVSKKYMPAPTSFYSEKGLDNKTAKMLMLSPKTGHTPEEWQQNVGTVYIIRADYRPLHELHLDTIKSFIQALVLSASDGRRHGTGFGEGVPKQITAMTFGEWHKVFRRWNIERGNTVFTYMSDLPIGG
ncbi:hypothetical protein CC2G_008672 [Coprinopsis cinerea AmutBmut pab1-1]|nr:hypothetical protein CC2G_008672 [Coprinopsis cinerea AmutBmut pab1-1]